MGALMLYYIGQDWALSSTVNFINNDIDSDPYSAGNSSRLICVSLLNSELYTTAPVSLALKNYGICLISGNYTIKHHLAEIICIKGRSFNSLGKKVFDVCIKLTITYVI